jgi:hypothetical protein
MITRAAAKRAETERRYPSRERAPNQFLKDSAYAVNQKQSNMNFKKANAKHEEVAERSAEAELRTMLVKDIFRPTRKSELTYEQRKKVIISFTFFKEKWKVDGQLDKLKARLVAGGHLVNKDELGDISSPTVKLHSVMLLFSLAAFYGLFVASMDVPTAYLNTRLKPADQIPMKLGKEETKVLISLRPEWAEFVEPDGTMLVLLVGGLYGLPQAAKLWYDKLALTLSKLSYKPTQMDPCVFVKFHPDRGRSIIGVHVDDLLHVYQHMAFQKELLGALEEEYGKMTVQSGDVGIYTGLEYSFSREDHSVRICMTKYQNQLLKSYEVVGKVETPCPENLMEYNSELPKADYKQYASLVMAIYYLALRVRFDILFTINYLSTRMMDATSMEMKNAYRILKYLNATKEAGLVLRPSGTRLHFYVDASYGIHPNGRSHSGVSISLGGDEPSLGLDGTFFVMSTVQKFVTVSSTEAEMNATYNIHQVLTGLRQFLFEVGEDQSQPSLVLQDNAAAMINFTRAGGPRGRTMPLNVRYYYMVELIEDGVVELMKIDTADMLADILTKPFYKKSDIQLIQRLLNDPKWMDPSDRIHN